MEDDVISLVEPGGVLRKLGRLVRTVRMREELTQPELALKSGVPMTTISRLERTGKAGTEACLRVLFALNLLDSVDEYLNGRLRLAQFPKSLLAESDAGSVTSGVRRTLYRVRHRREE